MIKPLPASKVAADAFVVCDIENMPDGEVISIDTAWRNDEGEIVHKTDLDWSTWWAWIRKYASDDPKFRMVYAHNGGGWDWLSLVEYLLKGGRKERKALTIVTAGGRMIMLKAQITHKFTLCFADSYQLLKSGLDDLATLFVGEGKVDIGGKLPHEILREDPDLFWYYVRVDTERLLQVLEQSLELIRESVAGIDSFGPTVASTAMKVFRTIGVDEPITVPEDPDVKAFLREGYVGGRVECFRPGYHRGVYVHDINSLYPSVMFGQDVPTSDRGFWTRQQYPGACGLYRIKFDQADRGIPPVFMVEGHGSYTGEGVYFSPEVELFQSVDPGGTLTIDQGYVFKDQGRLFSDYVDRLYTLRLEHPGSPISLLAKYLLNSLYGKFGQKPERDKIICLDDFEELCDMIRNGEIVTPMSETDNVFTVTVDSPATFEHVGIAGMITSAARVALYKGLLHVGSDLVYCDTDSVHCIGRMDDRFMGDGLGAYKVEESDVEGVYLGKKLYALRRPGGSEKITSKGVRVGGRNGCDLSFSDLVSIADQGELKCEFQVSPTIRDILTGGRAACQFFQRTRTIRRTAEHGR